MEKTIQVNGNFIIMEVEATNNHRMIIKKNTEIARVGEDYPEIITTIQSDKITLSVDITLYGSGNTTNVTTESVFELIKAKLTNEVCPKCNSSNLKVKFYDCNNCSHTFEVQ